MCRRSQVTFRWNQTRVVQDVFGGNKLWGDSTQHICRRDGLQRRLWTCCGGDGVGKRAFHARSGEWWNIRRHTIPPPPPPPPPGGQGFDTHPQPVENLSRGYGGNSSTQVSAAKFINGCSRTERWAGCSHHQGPLYALAIMQTDHLCSHVGVSSQGWVRCY